MYGLSRGRSAGPSQLSELVPGTLAGELPYGHNGGSGMVPAGSPIQTEPDSGGRVDDLGRHTVLTNPQPTADLIKIPGVESRRVVGGVRVAGHSRLLWDTPPFTGGHIELRNRVNVVVLEPFERMEPTPGDVLPSLRVPPPSDPYGRMCNNAAAAARR